MSRHSHDAYFKSIFSDPRVAADAIRRVLDPVIADAIDWEHIEAAPTDFIGDALDNHRADSDDEGSTNPRCRGAIEITPKIAGCPRGISSVRDLPHRPIGSVETHIRREAKLHSRRQRLKLATQSPISPSSTIGVL